MSVIKKNIAASFAGNIWQVLIGIAFIPVYIKLIGIESYGLIGFFAMLQGVFSLLDMGLSATLTRELARLSVLPEKDQEMRNLVRTLEVIYWCLAALSGTIVIIAAPFMANHWLNASELSAQTIEQAIRMMGLAMALQWPAAFYSGGLTGLQRQLTLNGINIGISTLRSVGAVLVLLFIAPTVQAFFVWQIVASLFNTALLAFFLWRCLPQTMSKATFEATLLRSIWRFAAGLSGIAILSTIFTQLDKLILSKLLSLEAFAYYTVAAVVAMNLVRLVTPVFTAIYPRFTQLVELDDQAGLIALYHKASQLISVLILPVALVIAAFSYELLLIWTQSQTTAEATHLILSILICGTAIFGLLHVPYALQLANGWTKLPLYTNTIAILFYIPMLVFMTYRFGAIGGAMSWLALNIGEMIVPVYFMHRRLLRDEKWRWYWHDSFVPFVVCLSIVGASRMLLGEMESQLTMIFSILLVSLATLAGAVISTATTRVWTLNKLQYLLAARRV
jgi:O-antigen/teichoic acid export membrane protein